MTYTYRCPNCGQWWDPEHDVDSPILVARQCPDCARAQADSEDAREHRRQDER